MKPASHLVLCISLVFPGFWGKLRGSSIHAMNLWPQELCGFCQETVYSWFPCAGKSYVSETVCYLLLIERKMSTAGLWHRWKVIIRSSKGWDFAMLHLDIAVQRLSWSWGIHMEVMPKNKFSTFFRCKTYLSPSILHDESLREPTGWQEMIWLVMELEIESGSLYYLIPLLS